MLGLERGLEIFFGGDDSSSSSGRRESCSIPRRLFLLSSAMKQTINIPARHTLIRMVSARTFIDLMV